MLREAYSYFEPRACGHSHRRSNTLHEAVLPLNSLSPGCLLAPPRFRFRLTVTYLMRKRMPAIFLGHGNPMNALAKNAYTAAWTAVGASIPRPRAILSISAHWFVPVTAVTAMTMPRTIHDFGGFPSELYEVRYPAPGAPDLANRVRQLLAPLPVDLDESWGLDHGTWSVLCHVFPLADIPVIQLSIVVSLPTI
jgi:aromatic ring-opening dioxygenase catalytic subunit (LigB family)